MSMLDEAQVDVVSIPEVVLFVANPVLPSSTATIRS